MKKIIKIITIIIGSLILAAFAFLFYLTPVLRPFPKPSGSYGVGFISKSFIDTSRSEIHSDDKSPRELLGDFYYPTQKTTLWKQYPYNPAYLNALAQVITIDFAQDSPIPQCIWKQLMRGVKSYSQPDAIIATSNEPFPVILFSHGIGTDVLYRVYLEDLASQGYIVVSIYHPYDTVVTVFPDGRIIRIAPELREMIRTNDREKIYPYRKQAFAVWLSDCRFIIDQLELLNQNPASMFYEKMDLNRIGALGHSHGGSIVIELVRQDERVKAGVDMDGWTKDANSTQAFNKPFMTLMSDKFDLAQPFTGGVTGWDVFLKNMERNKDSSLVQIPGAHHALFSDYIQFKWPLGMHYKETDKIRKEIQENIAHFFNKYLKDDGQA